MDVSSASHDYVVKLLTAGDKVIRFEVERNDEAMSQLTSIASPHSPTSKVAASPTSSAAKSSALPLTDSTPSSSLQQSFCVSNNSGSGAFSPIAAVSLTSQTGSKLTNNGDLKTAATSPDASKLTPKLPLVSYTGDGQRSGALLAGNSVEVCNMSNDPA